MPTPGQPIAGAHCQAALDIDFNLSRRRIVAPADETEVIGAVDSQQHSSIEVVSNFEKDVIGMGIAIPVGLNPELDSSSGSCQRNISRCQVLQVPWIRGVHRFVQQAGLITHARLLERYLALNSPVVAVETEQEQGVGIVGQRSSRKQMATFQNFETQTPWQPS